MSRAGRLLSWAGALAVLAALAGLGLAGADHAFPPDLTRLKRTSTVVLNRDGAPLRIYLSEDGFFRLPARLEAVDRRYLEILIAYEDKRFYDHGGVDLLALLRATWHWAARGRVVSGASTLTMQTARLLEPRPRTLAAKLVEMARAIQLERRFGKARILETYLTLAPFGGNREGIEAASRAYFGHSAATLTRNEAALLVALPQSPTRLRPDRFPEAARAARDKVLRRVAGRIGLAPETRDSLLAERLPPVRGSLPFAAPHLADRLVAERPDERTIVATVDGALQARLAKLARDHARRLGPATSLAILVIENRRRDVLAYLGSADFNDRRRQGQVDVITARRSPGSTLKPLIYGLALERGMIHPATLINDAPTQFGDYAPANFMGRHHGVVTVAEALRLSLNVPAVAVLDRLGPVYFAERLRRAGVTLAFPEPDARPGLALALGGVGLSLEDLVVLYAALADDGRTMPLRYFRDVRNTIEAGADDRDLIGATARWQVGEILRAMRPPASFFPDLRRERARHIAYKTGTSYGFRDAWALGFTPTHTVGVWVGRADGTPSPGRYGANTAAPILFQIFDHLPPGSGEAPPRPPGASIAGGERLPPSLRYLDGISGTVQFDAAAPAPRIVFPLDGSAVGLPRPGRPLVLEADGGLQPLSWVVNGAPLDSVSDKRRAPWLPDGPGFADIVLVDALGRRSQARVRLLDLR